MKICFVGLENLPVLAPEYNRRGVGGEQVQQTLLAMALARRGHAISMVVYDYGQPDRARWNEIETHKAYRQQAGIPVFRFLHPRWSGLWSALARADADIYYVSCAGMQLGLLALFCRRYRRKFVFRVAHDTDCEPSQLLISYWRDRKLYEYGLRHTDGILVQSVQQQLTMLKNYGLHSDVVEMLVDPPQKSVKREIDVLWVNNLRQFKRPDLFLSLAKMLPQWNFHMIGGTQPGFTDLFNEIKSKASNLPNLIFHGSVPYHDIGVKYASARVFVNTSDTEGFPNSYLQAWIRGTPVVAFFDPDALIQRENLGCRVSSLDEMANAVTELMTDEHIWSQKSESCKNYMAQAYEEERIMAPYLDIFHRIA